MKCAIRTDKKSSWRQIIISVLLAIFVIVLCMAGIHTVKKRNMRLAEEERIRREKEQAIKREEYWKEVEKEYIEFEKLFRENEDDLQRFIELSQESALWEKEYVMNFSGSSSPRYQEEGWLTILYDNNMFIIEEDEKLAEEFNENTGLKEALNSIKEKGVIIGINHINLAESIWRISFKVDPTYTGFIKSNNGVVNTFSWCDSEECEKYGYKNVEGKWYMWISPPPE